MYNPNVPSSNMGIAPISGQPSQSMGPAPMAGSAPMGPMGPPPPMMGGMPPPPMMAPPPMAPPIAPITEGLGGFGGSSAGRAGFSERMQRMTAPPKPRPMSQPMPVQPPMMPRPIGMMDGGIVSGGVEPVKMALGGFIGNPLTRDYSRDFGGSDSSYEDAAYGDDGYGRVDYGFGGDDSGGDDVDYYEYLDDDYVYFPPTIAEDLVVVPEPAPESGRDDRKDKVLADLIRTPVEVTSSPVVSDSAPVRDVSTSGVFVDPMSLETVAPVQLPVSAAPKAIDAVGTAPIVGAVESGEGEGASTEVDVLGANPISLSSSGITDGFITDFGKGMTVREMIAAGPLLNNPNDVNVDISNIPAVDSDFTARRAGEILDSLKVARPGGSSKTRIEDDGLANAMAAAQQVDKASSAVKAAGGSSVNSDIDYPDSMTIGEIVADQANRRAIAEANTEAGVLGMRGGSGFGYNFPKDDAAIQQTTVPSYLKQIEAFPPILVPSEETYNPTSSLGADPAPSEVQLEDAMGRGMPSTPYSDPYAGDIVTTDVRTDLGIGTPYYRVGDPIDETTQKMLDKSPLKGAMLGESLTPTDVTFLNSPEMNIFASTAPAQPVPVPATATAVSDSSGGPAPKSNFDFDFPNTGKTGEVFIDPTDSEMYFKDRFEPNAPTRAFESLIKALSFGAIDLGEISAKQREKGFEAYKKTQTLAYDEKGRVIGVKDPDGKTILLGPQPQDDEDTGGDDDDCPPGFQRVNGVCTPIQRVAANPATAISDSINKATLPSTLRPIVRDVVDDEDDEEETSDVGGLTIRRPKYFAGGGAVSEGMGSAIDSFISAMGGSVKKKSNVEPVNMFLGGLVDRFTGRNDYTDPYEELERDYGYDPTDPFGDGDTSYGDDGPSDTVTADTFIGPMQPNVTYQPPAAPVDTGGDDKRGRMMSFADDLRLTRQETSPFSSIYAANTQLDNDLALQGRRPVLGGILSKEPVAGTDTLRFEGLSGLKNLGVSMMDPIARAIDSSRASYMGLIPEEDMAGEALGLAGLTTLGGGMLRKPVVQTSTPKPANNVLPDATTPSEEAAKKVLELRSQGRSNEVTDPLYNAADRTYLEKNYPLDMSQQAKLARGSGMGFDVDNKYYHGSHTGKKIKNFNTGDLGSFFSNSPNVAGSYSPTRGGEKNLTEVFTRNNPEDFLIVEGRGNMYHDVPLDQIPDDITEGGTIFGFDPGDTSDTNFVSTLAKDQGYSGVEFRDIQDLGTKGPFSGYDPVSNVRTMFESTDIRSPNAIFDPEFAHLSNILAANKSKTAGLGAVSSSQTIQEMIDQLNKKAPLAEFENQKGQMVSGGLSGRQLDFALNNLARRLGIERPD